MDTSIENDDYSEQIRRLQREVASLQDQNERLRESLVHARSDAGKTESIKKWYQVVQNSPFGMHMYEWLPEENGPGKLLLVAANPAADTILGVESSALLGKTIEEAFPAISGGEIPSIYRSIAKEGTTWSASFSNKNDERGSVEVEVYAFQTVQNQMSAIFVDGTERKRTERQLRENERRLRRQTDILERSVDLISSANLHGELQYLNLAGKMMLGMKPTEDVTDFNIPDVHPKWAFQIIKESGMPTALAKGVWQGETAIISRDGKEIPVFQTILSHVDPDTQKPAYFSTVMRDITESRRNEQEILRLQQSLKNILDALPSVIIGVDENENVTHWNLTAEQRTGKSANSVMGSPLQSAYPVLYEHRDLMQKTAQQKQMQYRTKVKMMENNDVRYGDVTVFPLPDGGVGMRLDDVTERVQMVEALIQSEKMQSAGALAAGMAHEINNPLAAILQNVQVVQQRLSADSQHNRDCASSCGVLMECLHCYLEQRRIFEMLARVREAGLRASNIVGNMLSFSRRGTQKVMTNDLSELVNKSIELLQNEYNLVHNYDFRKIQIILHVDDQLPPIACEPGKIQQVILNLLANGAHAMVAKEYDENNGPQFHIDVRAMERQSGVEICVADNGTGMDESVVRRIFEPFYTTKQVGKGTGLGLAISYFIITEQHGGSMLVETEKGEGTRFRIQLPACSSLIK